MWNASTVWFSIKDVAPPRGITLETKIEDDAGPRNYSQLKLGDTNNAWWFPDGSMYVYYTPTHWAYPKAI